MDKQPESPLDAALRYAELGYSVIPVTPLAKSPPLVKWKPYQERRPTREEIVGWFSGEVRANLAIVSGDVIVADLDDPKLLSLVMEKCGETSVISKTPSRGFHLWYRRRPHVHVANRVDVKGRELDLRGVGGYAMVPPSRTAAGAYEWLGSGLPAISDLPLFKVSWTRERVKRVVTPVALPELEPDRQRLVLRARAYLATVEGAVSGNRGHDRTFRTACVLVQKFGLSLAEAWPLLKEWSDLTCEPPWSDRELEHKLEDALKKRR